MGQETQGRIEAKEAAKEGGDIASKM